MPRTPSAYLSHAISGRVRIKIPARRRDEAYFVALSEALLGGCPGVHAVNFNALTASVLIEHAGPLPPLAAFGSGKGLFVLETAAPPVRAVGPALRTAALDLDREVRRTAGGALDLWTLLALALLALAGVQMRRGQVLPPALSLAWQALTALGLSQLMNGSRSGNGGG